MRRLLLGSGGYREPERRELLFGAMREHFAGVERILFVPYAVADHDAVVSAMAEKGFGAGFPLDGLHRATDPVAAVEQAEAIYVGGGNTFLLVDHLQRLGLLEPIRRRVAGGMPYMGVSAGSNVACPTLCTTNDMPIVQPASHETLGLVDFQINPHYFAGQVLVRDGDELQEHFGETRDDRIAEYHQWNVRPVVGLWEGTHLVVRGESVELFGGPARLFRPGRRALDVAPGDALTDALGA
ncbi:MAG: dipeptidase PepE [Planctomycetota bacterium]|jgi:dipeptidase E|nr:dipeptidase PepE [Planctomycetota bacterium]